MRLLIVLAALSVTAWAADNTIGTWKRNEEKSKLIYRDAKPLASFTTVREAVPDGVKVTNTLVFDDGKQMKQTYTAKYDGKEYPVSGGVPTTIAIKQIDANTLTITTKRNRANAFTTSRIVVAEDGKSYTNTTTGTDKDGKPETQISVYEKK